MTPTSPSAKLWRPLPHGLQKPGFVWATPSYDVVPLNGYCVFDWTSSSNQIRALLVPIVQWAAVSTTVGERSDALQRCDGTF